MSATCDSAVSKLSLTCTPNAPASPPGRLPFVPPAKPTTRPTRRVVRSEARRRRAPAGSPQRGRAPSRPARRCPIRPARRRAPVTFPRWTTARLGRSELLSRFLRNTGFESLAAEQPPQLAHALLDAAQVCGRGHLVVRGHGLLARRPRSSSAVTGRQARGELLASGNIADRRPRPASVPW